MDTLDQVIARTPADHEAVRIKASDTNDKAMTQADPAALTQR